MDKQSPVMAHGLIAGMVGYAVIVVAYAAINLASGLSIFTTAARLGAFLVNAPAGSAPAGATAPVIAFNGVHLVVSLMAGMILSWIVHQWENRPGAGYFFFFVLLAGLVMGSFLSAVLIAELARVVGWTTVIAVNLLAAAAMVGFLFAVRPALRYGLARLAG
jgi:hypothetical protein